MSSEAITRNDLANILNEVLPATASEYKKLLWTNTQGAQTSYSIPLDASKYDDIEVEIERYGNIQTVKIPPTATSGEIYAMYDGYETVRAYTLSSTTLTFSNGAYYGAYLQSTNKIYGAGYCVPSKIYGIKYERIEPPQVEYPNYSTEEQQVGTWITGKPLYRKVMAIQSLPNNTTAVYAHGISNIGVVSRFTLCWYDTNDGRFIMSPRIDAGGPRCTASMNSTNVIIEATGTNWSARTRDVFFIVEYTKTTD